MCSSAPRPPQVQVSLSCTSVSSCPAWAQCPVSVPAHVDSLLRHRCVGWMVPRGPFSSCTAGDTGVWDWQCQGFYPVSLALAKQMPSCPHSAHEQVFSAPHGNPALIALGGSAPALSIRFNYPQQQHNSGSHQSLMAIKRAINPWHVTLLIISGNEEQFVCPFWF